MPAKKEKSEKESPIPARMNGDDIGAFCGKPPRTVTQWLAENGLKIGAGGWDVRACVPVIVAQSEKRTSAISEDLLRDKARAQKAEATTAEVNAALAEGSAVLATDVALLWEDGFTRMRVVIETFPGLSDQQREDIIARLAAVKLSEEEAE